MFKTIAQTFFASLVILSITSEATEDRKEHAQVGVVPLSPEALSSLEQQRIQESIEEENLDTQLASLIIPIKHQNWATLASAEITTASYSPAIYHWIEEFPQENIIGLEDGSEWCFDPSDAQTVEGWKASAPIVISPKARWFWGSNYDYVLTNRDTGESVGTNLVDGPIPFGNHSHWVAVSDWNNGHLHLMNSKGDRTIWEVAPSDAYLIKEWSTNQSLIIGENSSWLWLLSDHNHIIVNVEMNHFIRARPIDYTPYIRPAVVAGG